MTATITYHSIDDSGSPISIAPGEFDGHLRWLTSGRIRVLPLDELVGHHPGAADAAAVTFDDGFLNTRGPIEALLAHGVPVTIFVVTGQVGGTNRWGGREAAGIPTLPLLGWQDLEDLMTRGATIAAHTRTHPALTRVSAEALDDELFGAREELARRLGSASAHVAYPYGDVDDRVVARTGAYYRWGHTTEFRTFTSRESSLRLPRLDMYYFRAPGALDAWGTARFRRHIAWCRARRRVRAALVGAPSPARGAQPPGGTR
jgi:peptidoglycan/xylan/chitin deacetylase (PgdA/CDA1 family)